MPIQFRGLSQIQSTLIELIFEHALRIRLKADMNSSDEGAKGQSGAASPAEAAAPGDDGAHDRADSEATAIAGEGQSSTDADSAAAAKSKGDDGAAAKSKDISMIGKINNMISADVNTLETAYGFVLIRAYDFAMALAESLTRRSLVHAAADHSEPRVPVCHLGLEVSYPDRS